jgi:iron complex outermembrane recepter protein
MHSRLTIRTLMILVFSLLLISSPLLAQNPPADTLLAANPAARSDTPVYVYPFDVTVTAGRMEIPLKRSAAATTVVTPEILKTMPRTIAVDEALKLVPGVRIDNQADGSRVHLSIRGQGILSERGIRGIKVLLDGLPVNDPTGHAPDFYDVDWETVQRVEVLRGPAASLYGGSSSAGVVNIITQDGGDKPLSGEAYTSFGSNGFWKTTGQMGGTQGNVNYRISAGRFMGDGWRKHTAYWGNNFYGKLHWNPSPSVKLTPIFEWTDFWNENAEGLNIDQVRQDPRQANPDAIPHNEYQKTSRIVNGITGEVKVCEHSDVQFNGYVRQTHFREAVPSSIQFRTLTTPGATAQYNVHHGLAGWKNHISLGSDIQWQTISEERTLNLAGNTTRARQQLLSNEAIHQNGAGVFLIDRLDLNEQWAAQLSGRYDNIHNQLVDLMGDTVNLSGLRNFSKTTGRVGLAYTPLTQLNIYGNWGQGFLPPATEELANNPDHLGGFNMSLEPATSQGEELGARGTVFEQLYYDATFFLLNTDKDFDRYRVSSRPLETFYRNSGTSHRYGLETFFGWSPVKPLTIQLAYTYSHFKYSKPDSIDGHWLPNSPQHQSCLDLEYALLPNLTIGATMEAQSHWLVDSRNSATVPGFTLYHARAAYGWKCLGMQGDLMFTVRNLFSKNYIAFSEPDPDGNSYQPGPTREMFGGVRFKL